MFELRINYAPGYRIYFGQVGLTIVLILLRNAIGKVIEAKIRMNSLSELGKTSYEKLDKMLAESSGSEIYSFVELLEALGFKLEITVAGIGLAADLESQDFARSDLPPEPVNL